MFLSLVHFVVLFTHLKKAKNRTRDTETGDKAQNDSYPKRDEID